MSPTFTPSGLVTLTTDFGTADGYVGAMKGVMLSLAPRLRLHDLAHDLPPQDLVRAAEAVRAACPYFPRGTVHLVVVDPGVGTARAPVALTVGGHAFVAPDNGVLGPVVEALSAGGGPEDAVEIREISRHPFGRGEISELVKENRTEQAGSRRGAIWCRVTAVISALCQGHAAPKRAADRPRMRREAIFHKLSATFHGRDLFAPAAAALAGGVATLAELGPRRTLVGRLAPPPSSPGVGSDADPDAGSAVVVLEDRFGNLITDLDAARLATLTGGRTAVVRLPDGRDLPLVKTYGDVAPGAPAALIGSHGRLELAVRDGSARARLGLPRGGRVTIVVVEADIPNTDGVRAGAKPLASV